MELAQTDKDLRDAIVDLARKWSRRTGLAIERLLRWLGLSAGKYHDWTQRYGKINQHSGSVPRDFWLADKRPQSWTFNCAVRRKATVASPKSSG